MPPDPSFNANPIGGQARRASHLHEGCLPTLGYMACTLRAAFHPLTFKTLLGGALEPGRRCFACCRWGLNIQNFLCWQDIDLGLLPGGSGRYVGGCLGSGLSVSEGSRTRKECTVLKE